MGKAKIGLHSTYLKETLSKLSVNLTQRQYKGRIT
jgi:hypothetical protein